MTSLPRQNTLTATGRTWDVWFPQGATDSAQHMFYLQADSSLPADQRHAHSSIGHAVYDSRKGLWVADALPAIPQGTPGSFDQAVWTGSVLSFAHNRHIMLYTGRSILGPNHQYVQRIGLATSSDPNMAKWAKHGAAVLASSWPYSTRDRDDSHAGPIWRDPYLFVGQNRQTYAAVAARHSGARHAYSACIGLVRATDDSFAEWEHLPLLVDGAERYGEMEVPQVIWHNGLYYIFFTVHARHYNPVWAKTIGGARNGLHCYVTGSLNELAMPVNGTGSVLDDAFVRGLRLIGPPNGNTFKAIGWLDGEDTPQGFVGGPSNTYTITLDGLKVYAKPA